MGFSGIIVGGDELINSSLSENRALRPFIEPQFSKCVCFPGLNLCRSFATRDCTNLVLVRYLSNASLVQLNTHGDDIVRFSFSNKNDKNGSRTQTNKMGKTKRVKMSRKAKLNELRFYRLKAKKKMNSPNPEVRIRYKLDKVCITFLVISGCQIFP